MLILGKMFLLGLEKKLWLGVELSSKDTRKRIYKLKSPEKAVKEMAK